jgi:hypothetical protein
MYAQRRAGQSLDPSISLPTFFSVLDTFFPGQMERLPENKGGILKAHSVFSLIRKILDRVLLKPQIVHRSIVIRFCKYVSEAKATVLAAGESRKLKAVSKPLVKDLGVPQYGGSQQQRVDTVEHPAVAGQ